MFHLPVMVASATSGAKQTITCNLTAQAVVHVSDCQPTMVLQRDSRDIAHARESQGKSFHAVVSQQQGP